MHGWRWLLLQRRVPSTERPVHENVGFRYMVGILQSIKTITIHTFTTLNTLYKGLIMNETDVLSKCFCSLSGAVVADDECYSQNKQGTFFAYCTRPTNDEYIGCQKQ